MNLSGRKKIFLALAGLILATYFIFRSGKTEVKEKNDRGLITRADLVQRVTIAGTVVPIKKSIIAASYSGYIKKLYVKMGSVVKEGDPLVSVVQSLQSSDSPYPMRSPLSGSVVQINKSEGEYVKEGDPKEYILRVDDTSKLFVLANAPELDQVKLKVGQEAVISVSAILNRKYKGIIREMSLAAREKDQWSRSQVVEFPIKIEILDSDEVIKPGMSVVLDVITSKREKTLTLRHEFVRRDGEKYYVLLNGGTRRDVKVGLQNEESYEILSGLNEGESVKQVDYTNLDLVK